MTAAASSAASQALPERPPISAPRAGRTHVARQPALGLAGLTLVIPVALALAAGLGSPERSLLVLGPLSTFALPVIAMIAFWWEDWPGTLLRPPLSGLANTALVAAGGVVCTFAGQAAASHADVAGVFDPAAAAGDAPTFPSTMPLAGTIFVVMLQLTLVTEGWPLRRLDRLPAGAVALAASWAAGIALYEALVPTGLLAGGELGAFIVCIGALQVTFYVVLHGWPFCLIGARAVRLPIANAVVIAGGWLAYRMLSQTTDLTTATISAAAGSVVASGLIVGMLFEGWLDSLLAPRPARACAAAAAAGIAALLYVGLQALAHAAHWTRAEPEDWTAYTTLNALGAGVILHVAIGRRWPFATRASVATRERT
jgi:hypothetical protein